MRRARSRLVAFTLLEVLAAVAILALVYTVLARVGIQGFRAEGGADRRLRASLIADDVLAEIEGQLAMGSAPPLGEKEGAREEYLIHVRVTPADVEIPPRSEAATQRMQAAAAKTPAKGSASGGKVGPPGLPQSFFLPQAQGEPPPGRRIEVRVAWTEGTTESAVVRETYGLDQTAAQDLLVGLDSASKPEKEGADTSKGPPTAAPAAGQPGGPPSAPGAANPATGPTP